jgi:hypothetical protein
MHLLSPPLLRQRHSPPSRFQPVMLEFAAALQRRRANQASFSVLTAAKQEAAFQQEEQQNRQQLLRVSNRMELKDDPVVSPRPHLADCTVSSLAGDCSEEYDTPVLSVTGSVDQDHHDFVEEVVIDENEETLEKRRPKTAAALPEQQNNCVIAVTSREQEEADGDITIDTVASTAKTPSEDIDQQSESDVLSSIRSNSSNSNTDDSLHQQQHDNAHDAVVRRPKRVTEIIRLDLWDKDETVVESALQYLVDKLTHSCTLLELAIGEVGGIEAILGAMMTHITQVDVQDAAWSALCNCTCGNALDVMTAIDQPGGMSAIVSCMKQHVHHESIQLSAVGTLTNLCWNNESRLADLINAGGLGVMALTLQEHRDNGTLRHETAHAMLILLGEAARCPTN